MKVFTLDKLKFWSKKNLLNVIKRMQAQESDYNQVAIQDFSYTGKVARKRAIQARKNVVVLEMALQGK